MPWELILSVGLSILKLILGAGEKSTATQKRFIQFVEERANDFDSPSNINSDWHAARARLQERIEREKARLDQVGNSKPNSGS